MNAQQIAELRKLLAEATKNPTGTHPMTMRVSTNQIENLLDAAEREQKLQAIIMDCNAIAEGTAADFAEHKSDDAYLLGGVIGATRRAIREHKIGGAK